MIDGTIVKHLNLKKNAPQTVEFSAGVNQLSVVNMGNFEVYFKLDDPSLNSTQDETTNYLNDVVRTVDIDKETAFTTITFISNGPTSVQWDYR
jgi:hypothetical protein